MDFMPKFREYQLVPGTDVNSDPDPDDSDWDEESEWEQRLRRKQRRRAILLCASVSFSLLLLAVAVTTVVIGIEKKPHAPALPDVRPLSTDSPLNETSTSLESSFDNPPTSGSVGEPVDPTAEQPDGYTT